MARTKSAAADGAPGPTGWVDSPKAVDRALGAMPHPVFAVAGAPIRDTGEGKVVLLYGAVRKVVGKDLIHSQTIGDCVSHGWGLLVDYLVCLQIAAGQRERWAGETATEIIYAGSRVEVGRGELGNGDGSIGAWAARFVTEYGTLVRGKYDGLDLSTYRGSTAKKLGGPRAGVPDDLEPIVKEHPVQTTSLVTSYEEARDAIFNQYPVSVCSNQGFATKRDKDGFARPSGSWAHCMCFIAVDDESGRPGLLCANSWGVDWIGGPKRHDQPDGSFWVDADVADRMLSGRRMGGADSFAGSGFVGFPAQPIDHDYLAPVG